MPPATPLPFAPPQLFHLPLFRDIVQHFPPKLLLGKDCSFAHMFLSQKKFHTELAFEAGVLFRHYAHNSRFQGYAFPLSTWGDGDFKDVSTALARVEEDAVLRGRECHFCLLSAQDLAMLQLLRPGQYRAHSLREDSDTIYRRGDIKMLSEGGSEKKGGLMENFREKIRAKSSTWNMEAINLGSFLDVINIARAWEECGNGVAEELTYIKKALAHWRGLDLRGVLLRIDQRACGFAIATQESPGKADLHYEKWVPEWQEAEAVLIQGIAEELGGIEYINRGEGVAMVGQMSKHPHVVLDKYCAVRQF